MTNNPRFKKPKLGIDELENRYIDLFNRISDLIMVHDLEGRLLDVNPAVSKLSGYTFKERKNKAYTPYHWIHSRYPKKCCLTFKYYSSQTGGGGVTKSS